MKHRIVITRHRPWLKPALIGGGSFALAVAAWALYAYTRASTVSDFERAQLEVEQLREERRTLTRDLRAARDEVKRLEEQAVYVQRSQEIDGQACTAVRESLTQLQADEHHDAGGVNVDAAMEYQEEAAPAGHAAGIELVPLWSRACTDRFKLRLETIEGLRLAGGRRSPPWAPRWRSPPAQTAPPSPPETPPARFPRPLPPPPLR